MRMLHLPRVLVLIRGLAGIPGCGDEAAGGADEATDPTTSGSPTSFTPTSLDEPTTTAAESTTDGPDGAAICGNGVVEPGEQCDEGAGNGASADCTDECRVHACGDGKVHVLEQCDEGAGNGASADCTDECRVNECGDGKVHVLEECDAGAANVDTGACRSDCVLNVCGDGHSHEGVEECDLGADNGPQYGGCDESCTINRCGDGELDEGFEQCDEGAENGSGGAGEDGTAGCGTDCGYAGWRLFLSSKLFTGDMGSRAGADLACQNMAVDAGLPHAKQFRALLADTKVSPNDFLAGDASGLPFIALSGEILAESYAALIDLGPGSGVTTTETGELLTDWPVWTNIDQFGGSFDTNAGSACNDWKSADPEKSAMAGYNAVEMEDLPEWQDEHQWFVHGMK